MTITSITDLLDEPTVNSGLSVVGQVSETQPTPVVTTATPRPLRLSVTWGDISQVRADIHIAGHYVDGRVMWPAGVSRLVAALRVLGPAT